MALEIDIAWAAGLFEGEGCITISAGYPRLKMSMTDADTVQRFFEIVGEGQVRENTSARQRVLGYKLQWEWYTGSRAGVTAVLNMLLPYLSARRTIKAQEILALYRKD